MSVIPRTWYLGWYLALSTGKNNRLYIDIPPTTRIFLSCKDFFPLQTNRFRTAIIDDPLGKSF